MEELVKKAQKGDREAFLTLMKESELSLYRAAKAIVHTETDVEDAVAETVCKAFRGIGGLKKPKYFKTWLTRILIHCCYDLLAQKKAELLPETLPEESYEENRESAMDVREVLSGLSENDRLVLTLYYFNDMSVKEIAALLEISQDAVKARLSQGRKRFRRSYEQREVQSHEAC